MTENPRDLLAQAVTGTEPPMRTNGDELRMKGRRRQLRRRVGAVGGGGAALAAVAALTLTVAGLGSAPTSTERTLEAAAGADPEANATDESDHAEGDHEYAWPDLSQDVRDIIVESGLEFEPINPDAEIFELHNLAANPEFADRADYLTGNASILGPPAQGTTDLRLRVELFPGGDWDRDRAEDPDELLKDSDSPLYHCGDIPTDEPEGIACDVNDDLVAVAIRHPDAENGDYHSRQVLQFRDECAVSTTFWATVEPGVDAAPDFGLDADEQAELTRELPCPPADLS